ncbi:PAS domain S-box protein (plasmid) [Haloferacaceae archaeon DSL9]
MATALPAPKDVLKKIDTLGPPGTPVTTPEVANGFDCTQRTIYNRLETLVDDGDLQTKKVGANSRVWWRPTDGTDGTVDRLFSASLRNEQVPSFLSDGEMAERIREFEWAETPLGPITEWPLELRVAVDLMLSTSEAIGIYWGDDRRLLYNDAAIEQIGEKHPDALGRPARDVFPEAWETLGPIHDQVMTGDGPVRNEEYYLPLERAGELEDIWWDSTFNPIPAGDGSVGGVFNISFDVTDRVQAERELRERKRKSEAKYRTLFESIDEGFCIIEMLFDGDEQPVDYRFLETNPRFEEITDLSNSEGERVRDLVPDHEDHWFEIYGRVARTGEDVRFTERAEHIGDRWYDVYAFRIGDPDGRNVAVLFDDITERKRAQEELRENEARLDAFVTATSDVVYRMSPDWSEMYYLDGREFIVDTEDPRETWLEEYIPADERERVMAAIEGAIETKTTFELKHQVVQVDGSRGWTHSRAVPILNDDGEIVEWFGTATDITERKRVETRLGESEKRLRLATDIANIAVFEWDLETGLVMGNERMNELFGYDAHEEIVGPDLLEERVHPDDRETVANRLERTFEPASDGDHEFEFRATLPDGSERWVLTNFEVYFEEDEDDRRAVRIHGTGIDITERKRREQHDQFLLELGDQMRTLTGEKALGESCTQLLARELGLDRAYFVRFDSETEEALVASEYRSTGLEPVNGLYPYSSFPEAIQQLPTETLVYDDVVNDPTLSETERWALLELDFGAWIGVPVWTESERADWALCAGIAEPYNWTDADVSLVEEAVERTWTAMERARAEGALRASNESLERLNDVSRELIDADPGTISNRVTEFVVDILDIEHAALWRYDKQTGELKLHSEHSILEANLDAVRPPGVSNERIWETFIDDDIVVEDALDIAGSDSFPSQLGSRVFVPLGRHGVIIVGSAHSETFDGRLVDLVEMVAATIETAWNRAESEAQLEQRNEELTRLGQLNSLIREIDTGLVEAETVDAIEETVCERLAASPLFKFAWIGAFDADTDAVRPRSWAGVDSSVIEELPTASGDPGIAPDLFVTAIRTHEMQVIEDIATDLRTSPWREVALKRGARSCFSIPLVYNESVYGVLVVYGGSPAQNWDTDVLAEFGQTIAHAINAVETRESFQANSIIELTLRSTTAETPLCRLAQATGSELEFEGLVPGTDGAATVFVNAPGVAPEQVVDAGEDVLGIEELSTLAERDGGPVFKTRPSDPTLAGLVLDQNATVRSLRIDAGTATVVVDLPGAANVRKFVEGLAREVPDLELLARRTRTREPGTTLQTAVLERLTPRQQEVLQLTYRSGYFETPRIQTGQELADALGIVPSTFTKHIRSAERNLLDVIFVNGHGSPGEEAK